MPCQVRRFFARKVSHAKHFVSVGMADYSRKRIHQMDVLFADQDRARARQTREDAREPVLGAHMITCRDPRKAKTVAKAKGSGL